ncbi:MAG: lysophospholipid acyltransferase family protein [Gammaproteobacteria bacterium]
MKAKIRLYSKTLQLVVLFLTGFVIAGGLFPVIGWTHSPLKAKQTKDAIKIHWLRFFSRILSLKIATKGAIARRPALIVSNHVSWLDIVVLGQLVPGCFAAKSDIAGWPVIGYLARQAGTLFIRRGDKKQILQTAEMMAWQLRQNGNMLVFPEGTTTDGREVLNFHASLFQPALLTRAAIQPAAIRYMNEAGATAPFIGDDEFVSHVFRMLALEEIEVRLDFLPVLDSTDLTRNTVSCTARNQIAAVLAAEDNENVQPIQAAN